MVWRTETGREARPFLSDRGYTDYQPLSSFWFDESVTIFSLAWALLGLRGAKHRELTNVEKEQGQRKLASGPKCQRQKSYCLTSPLTGTTGTSEHFQSQPNANHICTCIYVHPHMCTIDHPTHVHSCKIIHTDKQNSRYKSCPLCT